MKLRILHLEDSATDAELIRLALARGGLTCDIQTVCTGDDYLTALHRQSFDLILSDSGIPGYHGIAAMAAAHDYCPDTPFIFVSGQGQEAAPVQDRPSPPSARTSIRIPKTQLVRLAPAIKAALADTAQTVTAIPTLPEQPAAPATSAFSAAVVVSPAAADSTSGVTAISGFAPITGPVGAPPRITGFSYLHGMQTLVTVVQQLSLARTLQAVMDIVRHAARDLVGADGASFILRDGDLCFYADEDAVGPLWKGQRFPLSACISGWTLLNRQAAVIEDIYQDARIPHEVYRPTFVKSLVMTPIRTLAPIGAIGVYWSRVHQATAEETALLRALADSTSIALEAVDLLDSLERRVNDRTQELHQRSSELEVLNRELESFSYSVAHDLRAPLITIDGFSQVLSENWSERLDDTGRGHLERISASVRRMHRLINDLLELSKIVRTPMQRTRVDLSRTAREIVAALRATPREREVQIIVADEAIVDGDPGLLRVALENLLSNAWKFTTKTDVARIEFGSTTDRKGRTAYFVSDNGAGFDPRYANTLFSPFQRLHAQSQFSGTGLGLATVQRIIHRHGGEVWAEAAVDQGACFFFFLP